MGLNGAVGRWLHGQHSVMSSVLAMCTPLSESECCHVQELPDAQACPSSEPCVARHLAPVGMQCCRISSWPFWAPQAALWRQLSCGPAMGLTWPSPLPSRMLTSTSVTWPVASFLSGELSAS